MKFLLDGQESNRLRFRSINNQDYNKWLPFFENPVTRQYWNANYEAPEIECVNWYKRQFERYEKNLGGHNVLIEKKTNLLLGHCGLLVQTVNDSEALEIGYSLLPQFWNKGFATEAAKKCKDYAFENGLADELISIISLSNLPSAQVARKNGMSIKFQTVYNLNPVNIYGISISEWDQNK